MTTNPRIRVRDATPADAPIITEIHYKAFAHGIMDQLMYPNGVTEDNRAKFAARLFPPPRSEDEKAKKGENMVWVAEYVPDDGPAEIVAFSRWTLYRQPRPEEVWKVDAAYKPTLEMFGQGANIEVIDTFVGEMRRMSERAAKGEAMLFLGILACLPERQRLGAGSALLRRGVELADSLGLPMRLEASPEGYGLYKKFGFEAYDVLDTKVTETWGPVQPEGSNWGNNNAAELFGQAPKGVLRTVLMKRPVKVSN